jgi:hypothetical protein
MGHFTELIPREPVEVHRDLHPLVDEEGSDLYSSTGSAEALDKKASPSS